MPDLISKRAFGAEQETRAQFFFEAMGWTLLDRNYTSRMGELDLIFDAGKNLIVFMEIRFRKTLDYGGAAASVNPAKQKKIIRTALAYIKEKKLAGKDFRFDVAALGPKDILHIPNAFSSSSYTL
jgi:putative endonuclease